MKIKINEIFYSLAGEGSLTGQAMIFIRFSGCNLHCSFCDTKHDTFQELTIDEILLEVKKYPCKNISITGGEPTIQANELKKIVKTLRNEEYWINVETNGTHPLDYAIYNFVTISPKGLTRHFVCDDLKIIHEDNATEEAILEKAKHFQIRCEKYIQPQSNREDSTRWCIEFIKRNPSWRLSLQTHKLINIQ